MNHPKQRSRGRGNTGTGNGKPRHMGGGGGNGGGRNQVFDSNGPDGRIRGNAHQVMERYLAMARDASAQGDRVMAENCYQHAEHYLRLLNAYNQSVANSQPRRPVAQTEEQGEEQAHQGEQIEDGDDDQGDAQGEDEPNGEPLVEAVG